MGMIGNSLAQGLISGANIQDGTVDTPDIKDSAVTAAKIASAVVTPAKMDFSAGTANGVLFLNGSKVASSGSALVFDGTKFGIGAASPAAKLEVGGATASAKQAIFATAPSNPNFRLEALNGDTGTTTGTLQAKFGLRYDDGSTITDTAVLRFYRGAGAADGSIGFVTNNTLQGTLDASGNFGLGVTPSDWTSYKAIQVAARSMFFGLGSETNIANNVYHNVGFKYVASSAAGLYTIDTNVHKWYRSTDVTPTAGNGITLAQAMTLDANGYLGVGTTPQAGGNGRIDLLQATSSDSNAGVQVRSFAAGTGDGSTTVPVVRAVNSTAGNWANAKYHAYAHIWGVGGSASSSTAMTLDASGNLGIGSTSPAMSLNGSTRALYLYKNDTSGAGLRLESSNTNFEIIAGDSGVLMYSTGDDPIRFGTSNTERARIDSSGNLLVGTTSGTSRLVVTTTTGSASTVTFDGSVGNGINIKTTYASTGSLYLNFQNSAGNGTGSISQNGTTTVAYTTSSDYRMKENVAPMTGALAKVSALNPVTYTWKEDGSSGEGFIAHELQEVCPHAVVGEKDAVNEDGSINPQGIDTSYLVATLTAAIQEQQAIIEQMQSRLAALEGA
jgi:hypothetical protein